MKLSVKGLVGATVGAVATGVAMKLITKAILNSASKCELEKEVKLIEERLDSKTIGLEYLNNSKQEIIEFLEDLVGGKYDEQLKREALKELLKDKERAVEKIGRGLSMEEAIDEMLKENIEKLIGEYDNLAQLRDAVELYNGSIEQGIEHALMIAEGCFEEEDMEIFERSFKVMKDIRVKIVNK